MTTTVHHVHDVPTDPGPEWVYAGRATPRATHPIAHRDSPWRNPYAIPPADWSDTWDLRGKLACYRRGFRHALMLGASSFTTPKLADGKPRTIVFPAALPKAVRELEGLRLVCWCATPGHPLTASDPLRCHCQLLAAASLGLELPEVL